MKHAVLILAGGLMIYPLLWMVVSSLRPNELIFREPGLWLNSLEMSNYTSGWSALTHPFGHYMINSAIVVIVPQYILFSQIGWVNTFWPLIVPKLLATDAFFVFLMVQFIRGIPKELDEAARIDGAGHPRIFLRVILPLMVPALATTTIFTFIWTWNDFFGALIYLTDPDMFTVPVALRAFVDSQSATSWGSLFAMSIVSLFPVFLVFLFGQRFLIKGIATTGIK
jgi:multiple sugar transport system permease protein